MVRFSVAWLLLVLAVSALAGCGGDSGAPPNTAGNVEAALLARLEAKFLSVRWIECTGSGYDFESEPVFRCNVNFGDPHLESYCGLMRNGDLVTHVEEPKLRCARERTAEGELVG